MEHRTMITLPNGVKINLADFEKRLSATLAGGSSQEIWKGCLTDGVKTPAPPPSEPRQDDSATYKLVCLLPDAQKFQALSTLSKSPEDSSAILRGSSEDSLELPRGTKVFIFPEDPTVKGGIFPLSEEAAARKVPSYNLKIYSNQGGSSESSIGLFVSSLKAKAICQSKLREPIALSEGDKLFLYSTFKPPQKNGGYTEEQEKKENPLDETYDSYDKFL